MHIVQHNCCTLLDWSYSHATRWPNGRNMLRATTLRQHVAPIWPGLTGMENTRPLNVNLTYSFVISTNSFVQRGIQTHGGQKWIGILYSSQLCLTRVPPEFFIKIDTYIIDEDSFLYFRRWYNIKFSLQWRSMPTNISLHASFIPAPTVVSRSSCFARQVTVLLGISMVA